MTSGLRRRIGALSTCVAAIGLLSVMAFRAPVSGSASAAGANHPAVASQHTLTLAELAGPTNCLSCSTCWSSSAEHIAPANPDGANANVPHSTCVDVPDCPHPLCGGAAVRAETEVVGELAVAASEGDLKALRTLIIDHRSRVAYNVDRAALQISGCTRALIGNIPLSAESVAALPDLRNITTYAMR
ncbi:MAG: hypothetical protein ABI637_01455 [Gemmatimonadota bacterium]